MISDVYERVLVFAAYDTVLIKQAAVLLKVATRAEAPAVLPAVLSRDFDVISPASLITIGLTELLHGLPWYSFPHRLAAAIDAALAVGDVLALETLFARCPPVETSQHVRLVWKDSATRGHTIMHPKALAWYSQHPFFDSDPPCAAASEVRAAMRANDLDTLKVLHRAYPESIRQGVSVDACAGGNILILEWLLDVGMLHDTAAVLLAAATANHIHVLAWWREHLSVDHGTLDMELWIAALKAATLEGHVPILLWLWEYDSKLRTRFLGDHMAMVQFVSSILQSGWASTLEWWWQLTLGHSKATTEIRLSIWEPIQHRIRFSRLGRLELAQWYLAKCRKHDWLTQPLGTLASEAVRCGDIPTLDWAFSMARDVVHFDDPELVCDALTCHHVVSLDWLWKHRHYLEIGWEWGFSKVVTSDVPLPLYILSWWKEHLGLNPRETGTMLSIATTNNRIDVLQWWHDTCSDLVTEADVIKYLQSSQTLETLAFWQAQLSDHDKPAWRRTDGLVRSVQCGRTAVLYYWWHDLDNSMDAAVEATAKLMRSPTYHQPAASITKVYWNKHFYPQFEEK
ncbi:hypothetical protein BC828DRAFT_373049 [Blastocladiella britannica]|nr:hypothetical protein BC828DRAFT_373049 [Blastocladiella britannica]